MIGNEIIACLWCARKNKEVMAQGRYCEAYENLTIEVSDILYEGNFHISPLPGDNGLTFVPVETAPDLIKDLVKTKQKNVTQDDIADMFNE
jgi:hypothetical protein